MFIPDKANDVELADGSWLAATQIFEMQNDTGPECCGTLGFAMGTAMALGNIAAAYVTGATPKQKKDFLKIIQRTVKDSFDEPITTATIRGVDGVTH